MTIDVVHLRGTGEPVTVGTGVSGTFLAALGDGFNPILVDYEATYGVPGAPYLDSCKQGYDNAVKALMGAQNPVLLSGYSQGAQIAGDLARDIAAGKLTMLRSVVGCALIADPSRPATFGVDPVVGYGISGQRRITTRESTVGMPAWWTAAQGDLVTALPAGSPLRSIADLTGYFSVDSPQALERWGLAMLDDVRRRRMQRWWDWRNWQTWGGTIGYLEGWLAGAKHTDAYLTEGHVQRLADAVRSGVKV